MKKRTKTLLALSAALSASVMLGALAGCGEKHTHVDVDPQDGVCDECGEAIEGYIGQTYDVKFETNGGTAVPAQGIEAGGKAVKPGDPKRYGFAFGGWYTDDTFATEFNFETAINADTTLYAKWVDAEATAESFFTFADVDGGVSVAIKTGQTLPADTVLPREYNSKAVVEIAEQAFEGQTQLTGIKIPASVKKIGTQAFRNCEKLAYVEGGENVEEIGANAFYGSAWDLSLPAGEAYLGKTLYKYAGALFDNAVITVKEGTLGLAAGAFQDMEKLTGVVLPEGLKNIGSYALGGSEKGTSITSIVLPDSVEYVAENAFRNSKKLAEVTIGKNLKEIGANAFAGTAIAKVNYNATDAVLSVAPFSGLETPAELVIGDELTGIPTNLTKSWPGLSTVHFGKNITALSESMFDGAAGIKQLTIPETVTAIGNYALRGTGIRELTIPASVKSIGAAAFANCTSLVDVYYNAENAEGTSEAGAPFAGCTSLDSVTFGREVKSIPAYLFKDSTILSVTLGSNVEEIGTEAFSGTQITSIDLKHVRTIGDMAFYQCPIHDLELRFVENIGDRAFEGNRVAGLHIPESVKSIGRRAFAESKTLTDVYLYAEHAVQVYDNESDRMFYNVPTLSRLVIGADVVNIPAYMMYRNTLLKSVTFPTKNDLEEKYNVGAYAFNGCSNLATVSGETYIETTGMGAFDGTAWITSYVEKQTAEFVYVGSTLYRWNPKNVPAYVAGGVAEDQLLTLTIPAKTTSINDNCFTNATAEWYNAWSVAYTAWNESIAQLKTLDRFPYENYVPIKEIVFEDGCEIESIGKYAFRGFGLVESITIPETVKSIGDYAFRDCLKLKQVNFGEHPSLESIGEGAFFNCLQLRDLELPETLKSIGKSALYGVGGKIVLPEACTDIAEGLFAPDPTNKDGGSNSGIFANLEELVIKAPIEKVPANLCTYQANLAKVTLPDTVTEIGNYAFNTTALTSIDLSNVTTIGEGAFTWRDSGSSTVNNTYLTEVIFNPDVENIAKNAFTKCVNLTGDFVFNKLEILQKDVFSYCAKINSLTFKALTEESEGLLSCTGLTSLDFGPALTSISSALDTTSLKVLHLPASLVEFKKEIFNPSSVSSTPPALLFLYLDGTIDPKSIPANCFKNVSHIVVEDALYDAYTGEESKWASVKDKIIKVSDVKVENGFYFYSDAYVNYYSGDRTNVVLPASVDSITSILDIFGTGDAYAACKSFSLAAGHTNLKLTNGMLTNADGTTLYAYFKGEGSKLDLTNVTKIADYALYGVATEADLTTALKKEGLTIGNYVFGGLELETLTIDENIKATLGTSSLRGIAADKVVLKTGTSFYGASASVLELDAATITSAMVPTTAVSVVLGQSVTKIDRRVFYNKTSLQQIEFKNPSAPTVGATNFSALSKLTAIYVPAGSADAYKAVVGTYSNLVYSKDREDETWTIYSGKVVAYNGDYTSVEIPKEVTVMDSILDIFGTEENLAKCTSLTVAGENTAFKVANEQLTNKDGTVLYYNMAEGETLTFTGAIKANSLGKATSFTLTVPATTTSITSILDLFGSPENALKCTTFTLAETNSGLKYESNMLTSTDGKTLYWFNNATVTTYDFSAFTTIAPYAAYGRTKLAKITIGESTSKIGDYAFARCAYKLEVTIKKASVITAGVNPFGKGGIEFAGTIIFNNLTVRNAYRQQPVTSNWKQYESFYTYPATT